MVKLRLKRYGRKQRMTYRIVAINAQSRRDGKVTREIGFYNPRKEETQLDILAIVSLCRSGAKLTETVRDILKRAKLFE
uniref:Small ribosomal subunit protein bS16c n=1 Tax=Cryptogramma acrostichoides TaxID=414624 RepID=A0A3G5CS61_9MONI|nr:ribosomal protein S16 [Cryptogramma acrostichoides]AYW15707.1 ribosomal protein S16 [Cryptogramma acrostichoides]